MRPALFLTGALHVVFSAGTSLRGIMYLTGQHPVVPSLDLAVGISHVALAFMNSAIFNADETPTEWPLFMSVSEARQKFTPGTKVMVAIGGWGDTHGFEVAARSAKFRERWARNVLAMVLATGADGVDVDWEYPGGNGEDYKRIPNSDREWEIDAYPLLLAELRNALGPSKLISAAVPGLERDMIAFTNETVPKIMSSLNYINVMTYDLMNRRDNITRHHTGIAASLAAIEAYRSRGAPPDKLILGFAFYVKFFRTTDCTLHGDGDPLGCPTLLLEDPVTGADLGRTGAFSWHDDVPNDVLVSFTRARAEGVFDPVAGGHYFWDASEKLFWTWDTPEVIEKKIPLIVERNGLGGVFAWGLGEDAPDWRHWKALRKGMGVAVPKIGERERVVDEL